MKLWSASLFGAVAAISITLAVATVWLVLTDPVTVATSVSQGEITPLVQELAQVILDALRGLLRYL
jgi:ABC-type phosphate transport system permease subunit